MAFTRHNQIAAIVSKEFSKKNKTVHFKQYPLITAEVDTKENFFVLKYLIHKGLPVIIVSFLIFSIHVSTIQLRVRGAHTCSTIFPLFFHPSPLTPITLLPHYPITPLPHYPITPIAPLPHCPITPLPHYPITPIAPLPHYPITPIAPLPHYSITPLILIPLTPSRSARTVHVNSWILNFDTSDLLRCSLIRLPSQDKKTLFQCVPIEKFICWFLRTWTRVLTYLMVEIWCIMYIYSNRNQLKRANLVKTQFLSMTIFAHTY